MSRLSKAAAVLMAITTLGGAASVGAAPASAYSGPANLNACNPNPVPSLYQPEINRLIAATYDTCAAVPHGTYFQTSGNVQVPGGMVWRYVQQNPDGYTQLQLTGPNGWYAYWQQNPPDPSHGGCAWYQEQVNVPRSAGGNSYFATGWYCG
jgi:hypothetical protein